jgi:3',5'-cyclic-AMP phosphodiesterase
MRSGRAYRCRAWLCLPFFAAILLIAAAPAPETFHFAILGDRTGETEPGIYEHIWAEAAATKPAFVVTTGDTIQGFDDAKADSEWGEAEKIFAPYRRFPLYLVPGNHDIWSAASEELFRRYAAHPPHYSFDYGPAHFTILDNSREEQLSAGELTFLEQDLKTHASQPLKFVVSHRPSWIFNAAGRNPDFALHQIVRKYGVQYIIAGHLHEMLHFKLEGIDYISLPSSGGHLRGSGKYEDGWFFGFATVDVDRGKPAFRIHQTGGPVTALDDWGPAGITPSK